MKTPFDELANDIRVFKLAVAETLRLPVFIDKLATLLAFLKRPPDHPGFVDPTGVLMVYIDDDCYECGAPWMRCVSSEHCVRSRDYIPEQSDNDIHG